MRVGVAHHRHLAVPELRYFTETIAVNGDFFNKLTPAQKKWIEQAASYATQVERQKTFEQASGSKAKTIAEGAVVVENSDIDTAAFKAIALPIQDEFAKKNGMERFLKMARQ